MLRKYIKKISCMLLLAAFVLSTHVVSFAAIVSEIDFGKSGSVSLVLRQSGNHEPVPGAAFALYYVADIDASAESRGFIYDKTFGNNGMLLGDLQAEGLAAHLADYASEQKIKGDVRKTDTNGQVMWDNLDLGLYLIVRTDRARGEDIVEPFLISVPIADNDGKRWIYDVDASPKTETVPDIPSETEQTVKKVWVDNGKNTPDNIEVKLFCDHKEYDSCVLNKENNWTYTWKGLSDDCKWTVKETKVPTGYKVSYSTTGTTITVTNTSTTEKPPTPPLIQTGQMNWPIPLLAGSGILIFAAGWYMVFVKKRK